MYKRHRVRSARGAESAVATPEIGNVENTNARFLYCGAATVRHFVTASSSDSRCCRTEHFYFPRARYFPSPLPQCYRIADIESYLKTQLRVNIGSAETAGCRQKSGTDKKGECLSFLERCGSGVELCYRFTKRITLPPREAFVLSVFDFCRRRCPRCYRPADNGLVPKQCT